MKNCLNVRLDEDRANKLQEICDKLDKNNSIAVRDAIDAHYNELKDIETKTKNIKYTLDDLSDQELEKMLLKIINEFSKYQHGEQQDPAENKISEIIVQLKANVIKEISSRMNQ